MNYHKTRPTRYRKTKLTIGTLYHYIGPRRMYSMSSGFQGPPMDAVIQAGEPFVLLETSKTTYDTLYRIKVLSTQGVIGWIDVNNVDAQFREYSDKPW